MPNYLFQTKTFRKENLDSRSFEYLDIAFRNRFTSKWVSVGFGDVRSDSRNPVMIYRHIDTF